MRMATTFLTVREFLCALVSLPLVAHDLGILRCPRSRGPTANQAAWGGLIRGGNDPSSVAGNRVDGSETEEIALHYAIGELMRNHWKVGRPPSPRSKEYDLIAARPRERAVFVEVKGLRSSGQFFFSGENWYDPSVDVVADVVIGVRARPGRPVEFYIGLTKEVQSDLEARENSEWAPWRQEKKYRDRWDKLEDVVKRSDS